jgi:hypothetical protein
MKSQSTTYPAVTQYDSEHVAVPINVTAFTKENPMGGDPMTGFEYELLLVPAKSLVQNKELINAICQAIILDRFSVIHQANVANSLYPDNNMRLWISAMVAESNRCTELIDESRPAVPNWPAYTGGV